jgi:hypothetical protein
MKNILSIIVSFCLINAAFGQNPTIEIANATTSGNEITFNVFLNPTAGQTIYVGNFDINLNLPTNTTVTGAMRTVRSSILSESGATVNMTTSISADGRAINYQPAAPGDQTDFNDLVAKATTRSSLGTYKITFASAPSGSVSCGSVQVFTLAPTGSFNSSSTNAECGTAVMPVELMDFKVQQVVDNQQVKALLTWLTANESNIDLYELERSPDGTQFTPLSKTAALNGTKQTYQQTDDNLNNGMTYYRLKIWEKDGSFNYSKIVSLQTKNKVKVSVYPTITRSEIVVENARRFDIVNMMGQVVLNQNTPIHNSPFNIHHLPSGMYLVRGVDTEGGVFFGENCKGIVLA